MHSKGFKVSTAIINFYLPLLVLICLNGRIYYEIKIRYKNVLLQRHSNKTNESPSQYKLISTGRNSRTPMAMAICDSDRQICSTINNFNENDSLITSRPSLTPINENNSQLRINIKEKKARPIVPIQIPDNQRSTLKHAYLFGEKKHCTQVSKKKIESILIFR
jgi:hypothetical protein